MESFRIPGSRVVCQSAWVILRQNPFIYIYIYTIKATRPVAEAMGIDAQFDGYGKGEEEIKRLKVNGSLACFFFANAEQNDLPEEVSDDDWLPTFLAHLSGFQAAD